MSVVIISNNKLSGNITPIGNINGLKGSHDWSLFLDFTKDKYFKKLSNQQSEIEFGDTLVANHNFQIGEFATPKTMLRNGQMEDVVSNNQIRKWLSPRGNYGVLIEPESQNILVAPDNPINRSATLPIGTSFIASVIGSGSMIVTGDNIVGSPVVITQANPAMIKTVNNAITSSISVSVENITHYQIEAYGGFPIATSQINAGSVGRSRKPDLVKINPSLIAELALGSDYTILMQHDILNTRLGAPTATNVNESRIHITTNTNLINLAINRNGTGLTGQSRAPRITNTILPSTTDGAVGGTLDANDEYVENFVYRFSANEVKGFGSGQPSTSAAILGKSTGSQVNDIEFRGGKFILTKLVIYKRALSDVEIEETLKSWI